MTILGLCKGLVSHSSPRSQAEAWEREIENLPGPDMVYRLNKLIQAYDTRVSLVVDLIA